MRWRASAKEAIPFLSRVKRSMKKACGPADETMADKGIQNHTTITSVILGTDEVMM